MYFWTLSKVDQRKFLSPGVRCDVDQERMNKGGNLSNVRILINYRLEKPDVLEERLNTAIMSKSKLPVPAITECHGRSQEWLHWAVGRSVVFSNQPNPHLLSRANFMGPTDRAHDIAPEMNYLHQRVSSKEELVVQWLENQRKEHLVLPTEHATVLPYQDKREAHAMFVLDTELQLGVPFQEASRDLVFALNTAADDVNAADLNERDMESANRFAQALPQHSRYGNESLGPRGDVPEAAPIASLSYFGWVWNHAKDSEGRALKNCLKIRKWIPFATCTTCSTYKKEKKDTECPVERKRLKALQREHLERVKRERVSYLMRQKLSILYPARYLSLIIDGADASRYMVPHLAHRSHATDGADLVKMHVLGCIAHGRDTYAYTCPPHIAQGHNVTIQVLDRVLLDIKRKEGSLPPILHIQLDNTTKQNKGKFLMAYLGYLVRQGVIKEAYCNFLPVGHTHEDVDQFFSRISVFSRRHDAPDDETLRWCIRKSFKKYGRAPIVEPWYTLGNISAYLDPFITPQFSRDITCYYQFRVSLAVVGEDVGEPIMEARTWPGAPENDPNDFWRGLVPDSTHVRIFKPGCSPDLVRDYDKIPPQAQPAHIGNATGEARPRYIKMLDKQASVMESLMDFFPTVFTSQKRDNVRTLLASLRSNLDPENPVRFDWALTDMKFLYDQGQYALAQGVPAYRSDENLYGEPDATVELQLNRPDPQRDPIGFQEALARGDVNLGSVENCYACTLVAGEFYLQRPMDISRGQIKLVKVVRVVMDAQEEKLQFGAWVQEWEVSTFGEPNCCCIADPYHARADQKNGQRYVESLGTNQKWSYDLSILSEFQVRVTMNKDWSKPKNWPKKLTCAPLVKKRNMAKTSQRQVRAFLTRWIKDDSDGAV